MVSCDPSQSCTFSALPVPSWFIIIASFLFFFLTESYVNTSLFQAPEWPVKNERKQGLRRQWPDVCAYANVAMITRRASRLSEPSCLARVTNKQTHKPVSPSVLEAYTLFGKAQNGTVTKQDTCTWTSFEYEKSQVYSFPIFFFTYRIL